MENNVKNLENVNKAIGIATKGLFATVDALGDKITPDQKAEFTKQKEEIADKMSKFTDVAEMLKDLQKNTNF